MIFVSPSGGAATGSPLPLVDQDCSSNPNYPAAAKGYRIRVTVAGKIGGASGKVVEAGDVVEAVAANAGGTEASVGTSWIALQANIAGMTAAGLSMITAADAAAQAALLTTLMPKTGSAFTGLTGAGFRDTSAAFDVTLGFTSSPILDAGRALTIDMGNVAHTIALGTTAGTITFPNAAALTVAGLQIDNTFTLAQTVAFGIAAATQGNGLVLTNSTAATNGNQTWSPSLRLTGNQWASGASRTCEFLLTTVPVQQNFDHNILRISTKHGADALTTLLEIRNLNGAPFIEPPSAAALTIGGIAGNSALNFQFNGTTVATFNSAATFALVDATNLVVGTTTGTKIGTATTQKLGFWNTTPVVQPAHIADPSGGAVVDAEARTAINAILAWQATLGLTAAA